jgi:hypothetical protein
MLTRYPKIGSESKFDAQADRKMVRSRPLTFRAPAADARADLAGTVDVSGEAIGRACRTLEM